MFVYACIILRQSAALFFI